MARSVVVDTAALRTYWDVISDPARALELAWSDTAHIAHERAIGALIDDIGTTPAVFIDRYGQETYEKIIRPNALPSLKLIPLLKP